jgi:hypothetical protein
MLLLVAIVATALGIVRAYWLTTWPNHQLSLGFYLLLVSVAIVAAIPSTTPCRPGFIGASIFGILYLVCGLNAGFGIESYSSAEVFMRRTLLGFPFVALSFMIAQLCAMLMSPRSEAPRKSESDH